MWENRKYVLLSAEEAEEIDYSKVLTTSANTLRWNIAKTVCFVKYDGNKPSFLRGKAVMTHAEIKVELRKPEWAGDPPDLPEE